MNKAQYQEWLDLTPKAPELGPDQRWHVFLSYRSTRREWVVALFDILDQLGFKVYIDYLRLEAGTMLNSALAEAIDQSASGILIWSEGREDSQWCAKEADHMQGRRDEDAAFRYVVVVLDEGVKPKGFSADTLRIDFADSPDGPYGERLMRLLCGLTGQEPPPRALTLSVEIARTTRESLAAIAAARATGQAGTLLGLGREDGPAWRNNPMLGGEVAEALIALGAHKEAAQVLDLHRARFPRSVRLRQLQALLLNREGRWREGQVLLATLDAEGHSDPETLGMLGRTWFDRYLEERLPVHLRRARQCYLDAWSQPGNDTYVGINAASLSLYMGGQESARALATQVLAEAMKQVPKDIWVKVTRAQAMLVLGRVAEAKEAFERAVIDHSEERGNLQSTGRHADLTCDALEEPRFWAKMMEALFGA